MIHVQTDMIIIHDLIDSTVLGYDMCNSKTPFVFNSPVKYTVVDLDSSITNFTIPTGFRSDGATLKYKFVRMLLGCQHTPDFLEGAFPHDFMCENKDCFTRKFASRVFLKGLLNSGVPAYKAYIMYLFVELYQILKGWA